MLIKILVVIITLILGWFLGILSIYITYNSGELIVYKSDPYDNMPNLFLNLDNKNPDELLKKGCVMLKVKQNFVNYTYSQDYVEPKSEVKTNSR